MESARALARLRGTGVPRQLGFSSFGDFSREVLGLAPGTAKDRLKLQQALTGSGRLLAAFAHGAISESKAIVLGSALGDETSPEAAEEWIAVAMEQSVRDLRRLVRETLGSCAAGEEALSDEDDDGRIVSFVGPVPTARMFDEAIASARKLLGFQAPRHECVEAMLAETSENWQRLEPCLEERLEEWEKVSGDCQAAGSGLGKRLVGRERLLGRGHSVRNRRRPARSLDRHPDGPDHASESRRSTGPNPPESSRPRQEAPHNCSARHSGAETGPGAPGANHPTVAPFEPTTASTAEQTLADVDLDVGEIERLIDMGPPREPVKEVDRVIICERFDAPLRILRSRVLRDLRDSGAMAELGFESWEEFARAHLGMSERAARSLVAEARLFAAEPALRLAYGRGDVTLGKAFLLRRVVGPGRLAAGLARAATVTHRQLAREVRVIEWASHVGVRLFLGGNAHEMEDSLLDALRRWGWTRVRVSNLLESVGLGPVSAPRPGVNPVLDPTADHVAHSAPEPATGTGAGADVPGDLAADPAVDPGVMTRLDRLIDLLILTIWDEPPQPEDHDENDRQTSIHANPLMTLRFWAPGPVARDWRIAIGRIREKNGAGCPPWAAAAMLIAEALQEWDRQDPDRVPTQERILRRDGYRCLVPGCSCRRNLEVHHIEFLSNGGSDEDWNKATVCHGHHRMIHDGIVRVWGRAPHDLTWELGCRPGHPPLMRFKGERIIWKAFGA